MHTLSRRPAVLSSASSARNRRSGRATCSCARASCINPLVTKIRAGRPRMRDIRCPPSWGSTWPALSRKSDRASMSFVLEKKSTWAHSGTDCEGVRCGGLCDQFPQANALSSSGSEPYLLLILSSVAKKTRAFHTSGEGFVSLLRFPGQVTMLRSAAATVLG